MVGRLFALAGFSLPDFYVGVLLLIAFSLHLDWFPMLGGGEGLLDTLHHLVLPAVTLGLVMAAFVMRLTRTSLLEVLRRDYVRTARGKGVAERWVIFKHALRNALIPVTTGLGIYLLTTLSGTITVELVFSRPGLGQLLIGGITARDYTMVQAGLGGVRVLRRAGQSGHRPALRRDRSADHAEMKRWAMKVGR